MGTNGLMGLSGPAGLNNPSPQMVNPTPAPIPPVQPAMAGPGPGQGVIAAPNPTPSPNTAPVNTPPVVNTSPQSGLAGMMNGKNQAALTPPGAASDAGNGMGPSDIRQSLPFTPNNAQANIARQLFNSALTNSGRQTIQPVAPQKRGYFYG